ncbi:HelD family protein [Clostridium vincentii]|uniref:DNA 3'-5' helicase n=1 Tax=Clostridium vincentii TaxID=52704 RepID=A0A2T0BKS6_9CLOT|nr:UvrD-helicase domain-containing protein [Clostridium vincentii]PRR84402.1 Helicase IV [Clostridium vincentii]
MEKDLEYLMEQVKLQETIKILDGEILSYIAKRKYITEYIIEYRKKYIEEYKDDEDRVIEFFDHEVFVKEEAYKTIDKRLKEFTTLKEAPYFGKITFTEESEGVQELYVGRFGLTPEETYEPVIVDWRAPIASLFYKGTLGESYYTSPVGDIPANLLARRQLVLKKAELKGIFDSAIDVKDEILQMVLTSNSGEKLKDIVMTIQQEQDEIIRAPKNKVIVVNGVAGSGKTTIALHRVSYLLYNDREQFGDKVLILGPNDIFMDYIAQVLPSLGEGGISQDTFQNFAIDQIGLKENVKSYSDYIEEAMNGNEEALTEYKYKSSNSFTKLLDNMIEDMDKSYFDMTPVNLFGETVVDIAEIKELFTTNYGYMPLFRRSEKIKRILISKTKDKRDEIIRKLNVETQKEIDSLSKEEYEIQKSNMDYQRREKIREIIRGVMDSREELDKWIDHEDTLTLYKRITKTESLAYMDLAGILYLAVKLDGMKCKKQIKHVVIDEAQDYNMTQFKVIKELTGCTSYTIVGDSNQRLIETEEEPAMLHLEELFSQNIESFSLNKSYRSTQEIMQYASQFIKEDSIIPLVRNGEPVLEEESTSTQDTIETLVSIIEDYKEEGLENIAIITKDKNKLKEISTLLKQRTKVLTFDREDMIYSGGLVLLPAYYAKGLEFDGVILLDDFKNTPNLVKYIMCTRALHRLAVIK